VMFPSQLIVKNAALRNLFNISLLGMVSSIFNRYLSYVPQSPVLDVSQNINLETLYVASVLSCVQIRPGLLISFRRCIGNPIFHFSTHIVASVLNSLIILLSVIFTHLRRFIFNVFSTPLQLCTVTSMATN
jgi:hypothetical protein